jgi:myo-inositol 2-dehydrogenase/D-chiro-inositol 1-dehydrogenase
MTIRAGLIGLGEVAQLMHLPLLADDPRWRIAGVSDISAKLTAAMGKRYQAEIRTTDAEELIAAPGIDAVFILAPDELHAPLIESALAAGKHVFVEKPAALTAEALRPLASRRTDRVVFVGYMRRFSRPFLAMKARMPPPSDIRHVRIRDLICESPFFVAQTRPVLRADDVPVAAVAAGRAAAAAMVRGVIGQGASAEEVRAYRVLTGLGSHSLSAMRELLGRPRRVVAAHQASGGSSVSALFDYGAFACSYEAVITDVPVFDSGIDVIARDSRLSLTYDTPYIRHLPTTLTVTTIGPDGAAQEVIGPHHADPFRIELDAFHDAIREGGPVKTNLEDSLADLDLITEIARHLMAGGTAR